MVTLHGRVSGFQQPSSILNRRAWEEIGAIDASSVPLQLLKAFSEPQGGAGSGSLVLVVLGARGSEQ